MPITTDYCQTLADRILLYFKSGITLDKDTCHYIESTFSNLSFSDLITLIQTETDFESAPLIELVFYPTPPLQIDLEPLIERAAFCAVDETRLVDLLVKATPGTMLHSPIHDESAAITIPENALAPLIARLNITEKLPEGLNRAIQSAVPVDLQNQIKVVIRNRRFHRFQRHIDFLSRFIRIADPTSELFYDSFLLVLDILSEQKSEADVCVLLDDKIEFYQKRHREALRFDAQLSQHNMETLMFQGVRAPQVNRLEIEKRLRTLGYIKDVMGGDEGF